MKSKQINSKNSILRSLCSVSFPLVLSLMSSSLMFFWDRFLLAQYSLEAHNAAVLAGTSAMFLQFLFLCTTSIAEVFVGKHQGAGRLEKTGHPVWQMIWLSVFTTFVFFPLGYFLGDLIFPSSAYLGIEIDYFRYMMYMGPLFCLGNALSAFYIGRGSMRFVTLAMISSNVLNIILAYLFIFGYGVIPAGGLIGAALATGIAQLFQVIILFLDFLSPRHRKIYGTGRCRFIWEEFYGCLKLGIPSSLAHTIEILAWAIFFRMLAGAGKEFVIVASIGQSIFFLFTFLTEGISKGATALAANYLGAKENKALKKLLEAGIKLYGIIFIFSGLALWFEPTSVIGLFLSLQDPFHEKILPLLVSSCFWIWIFFLLDGIHWLVVGLLTSIGDTKFVFKVGSTTIWFTVLLPTYFFIAKGSWAADKVWAIVAFYGALICSLYLLRFYRLMHSSEELSLDSLVRTSQSQ